MSSVWNPTKDMPRVMGDPSDDVRTEKVDSQRPPSAERYANTFDFPPSESDPRAAASAAAHPADDRVQASDPDDGPHR